MACVELSPITPTVIPLANCAAPQQIPAHKCNDPLNSVYSFPALDILARIMMLSTRPYIPRTPAMATGMTPFIVIEGFFVAPLHSPIPA